MISAWIVQINKEAYPKIHSSSCLFNRRHVKSNIVSKSVSIDTVAKFQVHIENFPELWVEFWTDKDILYYNINTMFINIEKEVFHFLHIPCFYWMWFRDQSQEFFSGDHVGQLPWK